ncbi:MAG: hypothetical protein K8R90_09420 [Candidatus Cloacimonetes bacterium]|nr:hypothetical protein [Candidatus Cloacimonadota bacterium]
MRQRIGTDIVSGGTPAATPQIRYIIPGGGATVTLRYQFTSGNVYIDWGDGSAVEALVSGGAFRDTTHVYAEGTWTVRALGDIMNMTVWRTDISPSHDVGVFPQAATGFGANLTMLICSESTGNGNNLACLTGLTLIWLSHKTALSDLTLNLSSLAELNALYDLRLTDHPNVTGDLASVVGHPLTMLYLANTGVNAYTNHQVVLSPDVEVILNGCTDFTATMCYMFLIGINSSTTVWTTPSVDFRGCNGGSCTDTDITASLVNYVRSLGWTVLTDGA